MTDIVYVDKAKVVAHLRARQLNARASWVEQELPGLIDASKNQSLLRMLGIDLAELAPDEPTPVA